MRTREIGVVLGLAILWAPGHAEDSAESPAAQPKGEFVKRAEKRAPEVSRELLEKLFGAIDEDGSGSVTKEEIERIIRRSHEQRAWERELQALKEDEFNRHARRAMPRDTFPVLHAPSMVEARKAEMEDDESVIGVVCDEEARAYPIRIMGRHELVNDVCGKTPIAASW